MTRKTKAEKLADVRIDRAYRRTCSGVQINILDIPNVFRVGTKAIADGADDTALDAAIVAYVATIRKN